MIEENEEISPIIDNQVFNVDEEPIIEEPVAVVEEPAVVVEEPVVVVEEPVVVIEEPINTPQQVTKECEKNRRRRLHYLGYF